MIDIDTAWCNFCNGDVIAPTTVNDLENTGFIPKCSTLYISTKTKISYLSQKIILDDVFWKIPIVPYQEPKEGIIKKQMKINSNSEEEYNILLENLNNERNKNYYIDDHIITRIVNEKGRIKYKDVRKISVGLHKKDIISFKCKKKGAFYNCFVVIIRIKHENAFKELHVKVFNTGKLEIPGIKDNDLLFKALNILIACLSPLISDELHFCPDKTETVLINSNFNCGYFINRESLFNILRYKYNINANYDPCSYPGIQCLYYEEDTKVSYMIFRTGSILIVGKCNETILNNVYNFIKKILLDEFENISSSVNLEINNTKKIKNLKPKKKFIIIEKEVND